MLVLAVGLAGCGSDDEEKGAPIPQQAAADIESRLAEVERRMDAGGGACDDIQNDTKPAVDQIVESLPSDVDPDVRDALQESVDRLFDLADGECDTEKGQQTETETAPAPEPEPEPETDTVTTETVPPETETTPPETETTEEPPPGEDGDDSGPGNSNGNGDSNGNGNGNGGGTFLPGEE